VFRRFEIRLDSRVVDIWLVVGVVSVVYVGALNIILFEAALKTV
jgi:hypothetical protein